VPGTVVAIEVRRGTRGTSGVRGTSAMRTTTFAPVVEYTDSSANVHRVTASLSGTRQPEVGSTVQVSYRADRPEKAIVMDLPGQRVAKWVFLVVGVVFTTASVIVAAHT
jgi:hypothetical protein